MITRAIKKIVSYASGRCHFSVALALLLFLAIMLSACNRVGRSTTPIIPPPTVAITSPTSGQTVQAGVNVPVNSTANDTQGILRVELWVDGSLYRVDASPDPEGQATFVVSQPWHAAEPGSHRIVVKAHSKSGQVAESVPVVINVLVSAVTLPTDTPVPPPTGTSVPPTSTNTPTSEPPSQATDTPVPPTGTPLPPTPTTTATSPPPESTDTPTPALPVPEPFAHVWENLGGASGRLGHPTAEAVLDRWMADQFFQDGLTVWRNNELDPANYICVLLYKEGTDDTQGTTWSQFEDLWREGMPTFSCPEAEANGDLGPKRGFGKVWCEHSAIRDGLELPVGIEQGANGGFQDFENGTMLWVARLGYVYVLYGDGDWQRF